MSKTRNTPKQKGPRKRRTNFWCKDDRLWDRVRVATVEAGADMGLRDSLARQLEYYGNLWGEPRARAIRYIEVCEETTAHALAISTRQVRRNNKTLVRLKLINVWRGRAVGKGRMHVNRFRPIWNLSTLEREHDEMVKREKHERQIAAVEEANARHQEERAKRKSAAPVASTISLAEPGPAYVSSQPVDAPGKMTGLCDPVWTSTSMPTSNQTPAPTSTPASASKQMPRAKTATEIEIERDFAEIERDFAEMERKAAEFEVEQEVEVERQEAAESFDATFDLLSHAGVKFDDALAAAARTPHENRRRFIQLLWPYGGEFEWPRPYLIEQAWNMVRRP
jgi:hypothetical protein